VATIWGVSWIRRRRRHEQPVGKRLPDLDFLALVKSGLEESAPGVTRGAQLKGNSLSSPSGWAVGLLTPDHGGEHHYDLVAFPDVSLQPDVPCFVDCVTAITGNPRHAADSWVETAGACLLELLDRRGRFAYHAGPDHEHGVPGWHMIASGAVGVGLDVAQNERMQDALLDANVLHRVAETLVADLESPYFNGIKVFYGGRAGTMEAEVRVNGQRHATASEAMAALGLPEPATFAAAQFYALLLPVPAGGGEPAYPAVHLELEHTHGDTCGCGEELNPEHPGFELPLPYLIDELSDHERRRRVQVDTGAMIVADGVGNFLKVRLPVDLDDGRRVIYLVWIYVEAAVIEEYVKRAHDRTLAGYQFEGLVCNVVEPWGEQLLRTPVVLAGQRNNPDGSIRMSEIIESSDPLLMRVLQERWPAAFVLGDRDPRLRIR
jgi:hypothetical protein